MTEMCDARDRVLASDDVVEASCLDLAYLIACFPATVCQFPIRSTSLMTTAALSLTAEGDYVGRERERD